MGKITNFQSYAVALMGVISFLGGGIFEFFVWTANCWFFLAILFVFWRKYLISFLLGLIALLVSSSFILWHQILVSESGRTAEIQSLEIGYFLWLASILFVTFSSVYLKITEKKMRSLKNLDIEKSIETRKLICEEGWFDRLDTFTNYFMFLSFMLPAIFGLKDIKPSANSDFEYFFYICSFLFGLYGLYCKFTEKNLKEIKFNIHKEEAKRRILEYGKKYNYRISKISNNCIFLNEPTDSFSFGNHETTTMIFFKDQSILYTLIKDASRLNVPVLISQHIIRNDLKRLLSLKKIETNRKRSYFSLFFFKD
ncbi:hypothetical protein [Chryseobacterium sp. MMS23-Vi53]|uniref:hypothetical protein n=1 Tax=Chryseobacterium sp. MMS23-Vi53 TaxID=3386644 RepID=UPI0039E98E56